MAQAAPGKSYRKGISLPKLLKMFPDDETARKWIEGIVWPDGPRCPYCGSANIQCNIAHKSMTHRCRDCEKKPRFSVKTGTVMQSSKLGYQTWAMAAYLVTTSLKSVSSMKLHRDLDITQKSAWHLAHRLRKTYELGLPLFSGPVEADETFVGGLEKNKHADKKLNAGRGGVGKAIVAGAKDRETNKIVAKVVPDTKAVTLQGFVETVSTPDAQIYTDEGLGYSGLNRPHGVVCHSAGEYVREMAHINGIESFWASLKRAHKGTFHKFSKKHLHRYVAEFSGKHNVRPIDTIDQMSAIVEGMKGKRLKYKTLKADNGLDSGAR
ncbi:MAG: IS1595 family transposase [Rhodobacteraceae bacterium]|nr:IS1595 family transposase [Paracoccaceae bacterium]